MALVTKSPCKQVSQIIVSVSRIIVQESQSFYMYMRVSTIEIE